MVKDYESEEARLERIANFSAALKKYVPSIPFAVRRILILGCGRGDEVLALKEVFPDAFIVGIDPDQEDIQKAQKLYGAKGVALIQGDARNLKTALGSLADKLFDIIVSRHPEVLHNPLVWKQIFREAAKYHRPGGFLIATFHDEKESMKSFPIDLYVPLYVGENKYGILQKVSLTPELIEKEKTKTLGILLAHYENREFNILFFNIVPKSVLKGSEQELPQKVFAYFDKIGNITNFFKTYIDTTFIQQYAKEGKIEYYQDKCILIAQKKP